MPQVHLPLTIGGGWATEYGPVAPFRRDEQGRSIVPWLVNAENLVYTLDGWAQKMPGMSNVHTSATGASDHVIGIFDYWRSTVAGSPVQRKVIFAGTQIYSEAGGGTLTSIKTGIEAQKMPWVEIMNDTLLLATTSTTDVPWKWDQTTFADLGGTPPNFSFMVQHKDRVFAAGVDTVKSRLYYTGSGNAENWTGAGSGSLDVRPDDGDVITALASHKNELIIFKGPHRGSIVRLTGSSPSDFALVPFVTGVGAVNQQSLMPYRDDLVWWSHAGIHSLLATAAFGDYNEAFLSAPIQSWFTKQLNHSRLNFVWGANVRPGGYALWTATRSGYSTHTTIVGWDYRFTPPRFFLWSAAAVASIGMILDTNRELTPWVGTYTGFVRRGNRVDRNLAGSPYTYTLSLPASDFGDAFEDKLISKARLGFVPSSGGSITLGWQRDQQTAQTTTIDQTGGGDPLGDSSAVPAPTYNGAFFDLNIDTLGQQAAEHAFVDLSGSFKELTLELTQAGLNQGCEPHSLALELVPEGIGTTGHPG